MIYEQNGNSSREIENITGNQNKQSSGAEKCNNWNEKFTRGIQIHIWIGKRKNQ